MAKQVSMTPLAAAVLKRLPTNRWLSVTEVARITGLSESRCQFLLTQFCLAGLMNERADSTSFQRR